MSDIENATAEAQPAVHLYELRGEGGAAYRAEGELVLKDGWFTVRDSDGVLALQIASHRVKAARLVDPAELEPEPELDLALVTFVRETIGVDLAAGSVSIEEALTTACRELRKSEEARERFRSAEGRAYMAVDRVRRLSTTPDVTNAQQEHPSVWAHGYKCGVLAAKTAAALSSGPEAER